MAMDPATAWGNAVAEWGKTAGKLVDAGTRAASFISSVAGQPIARCVKIIDTRLAYFELKDFLRLQAQTAVLLENAGMRGPSRTVPLKLAIPLMEAALLEDDEELQKVWATLLANGLNDQSGFDLQMVFVEILRQISPAEASMLQKIYSLPYEDMLHRGVLVGDLPRTVAIAPESGDDAPRRQPPREVTLGLANLARLGCVTPSMSWGGGQGFTRVNPTLLGKELVEACTLKVVVDPGAAPPL